MTTFLEQLDKAAEMEKQAYFEYVKGFSTSGISALAKGGMSLDNATKLVKEACEKDARASGLKATAQLLEKAAEYISELEAELGSFQKEAAITESEPLSKLANLGFTKEELEHMNSLPENLITKVASMNGQPWEMGTGVGFAREKTDPLLEFLLSPSQRD